MTGTGDWRQRLQTPVLKELVRATGDVDAELAIELGPAGVSLAVWTPEEGRLSPVKGLGGNVIAPILTPDARRVLVHVDDNGNEIGHVWSCAVDGSSAVDLTPEVPPYFLHGLTTDRVGEGAVITTVDDDGYTLRHVGQLDGQPVTRDLFHSVSESWFGLISADGSIASIDTTDHNPGVRRFALTVLDVASAEPIAVLSDGPLSPVRGVLFCPLAGDARILASTERSGFARPLVWDPISGERIDVDAPHLTGDLLALDWSDDGRYLLLVNVDAGVHRVLEYDLTADALRALPHPDGAYFEPDISSPRTVMWASHYGPGQEIRLLRQRFDRPLQVLRLDRSTGECRVWPGAEIEEVPSPSRSVVVPSADGTSVQMWTAMPAGVTEPVPFVLWIHGGPNLVSVDRFNPTGLAWTENGFGYAAVNYRGSVTSGRRFREGFWGAPGEAELEDIEACVRWLVAQGQAREDAVFISGESYGGFLTLMALGKRPRLFAGGLASVALADWALAYEDMHATLRLPWRHFLGDVPERAEALRSPSPLTYVDNVRAPLLMSQATSDSRTTPRQAAAYADRLRDGGGDVLLSWFDGGHETSSTSGVVQDQERALALVRRTLAGERWDEYAD